MNENRFIYFLWSMTPALVCGQSYLLPPHMYKSKGLYVTIQYKIDVDVTIFKIVLQEL